MAGSLIIHAYANGRLVLGINGLNGARRLARVLLADPLATESPWEKQLMDGDQDERAILLRYAKIDPRARDIRI